MCAELRPILAEFGPRYFIPGRSAVFVGFALTCVPHMAFLDLHE